MACATLPAILGNSYLACHSRVRTADALLAAALGLHVGSLIAFLSQVTALSHKSLYTSVINCCKFEFSIFIGHFPSCTKGVKIWTSESQILQVNILQFLSPKCIKRTHDEKVMSLHLFILLSKTSEWISIKFDIRADTKI
jgi:hypothetical protein